jgi:hypothetical protein
MKKGSKLTGPMSIRLEPDVKAAVQELAAGDDRSVSSYINRVLRQHIEAIRGKHRPKTKS